MKQKSETLRWDVQFFLKTPTHLPLVAADNLRIAMVTKSGWAQIIQLQEKLPLLKRFLENLDSYHVLICCVRASAKTAHEAIFKAHVRFETYIDSLAVAGFCIPAISRVIVVRQGNELNAEVMEFHRDK